MGNFGNKILHNYQIGVVLRFFVTSAVRRIHIRG